MDNTHNYTPVSESLQNQRTHFITRAVKSILDEKWWMTRDDVIQVGMLQMPDERLFTVAVPGCGRTLALVFAVGDETGYLRDLCVMDGNRRLRAGQSGSLFQVAILAVSWFAPELARDDWRGTAAACAKVLGLRGNAATLLLREALAVDAAGRKS